MTCFTVTYFTVPTVRSRRNTIACRGTFGFVAKSTGAFNARGVAGKMLIQPNCTIVTRSIATASGFTRRAFDFGCWTGLVIPCFHRNACHRIGFRLECIVVTIFASCGTIRFSIRSGRAFNTGNGPCFGGVRPRYTSGLIGGFTGAIMTCFT